MAKLNKVQKRALKRALRVASSIEEAVELAASRAKTPWDKELKEEAKRWLRNYTIKPDEVENYVEVQIENEEGRHSVQVLRTELTADKVKELAREYEVGKFIVFVDGEKISSPAAFDVSEASLVEIVPYDRWGIR